jgi:lysyl endopeptidase
MIRYLLLLLCLSSEIVIFGQIGSGGQPLLINSTVKSRLVEQKSKIVFSAPPLSVTNNVALNNQKGRPLRFAHPNFVELTPDNSGFTTVMDDGRLLWRLDLKSLGAFSLNVVFDKFHLAKGDSLYLCDPEGNYVIGALTHKNNKEWGGLATAPIPGDEMVIEWHGKNVGREGTQLVIGAVNHDFLNIFQHTSVKAGNFGDSGSCHTDLSCFEEADYLRNGQSVCRIIVNGTELCSATLINNSNNDGTPYILTAGHCLGNDISSQSVVFLFNYEVPACQPQIEGNKMQSISSGYLRAYADDLDFALLEMSEYPPSYFRPYYAGWNLTTTPNSGVYSIHHPQGDVKKVAVSDTPPLADTFSATSELGNRFEDNSHWRVAEWDDGTTEGGSSGAGLFLKDGLFLGHLSGGSATCTNPVNDYYVRLNKIWNARTEDTARVDVWLDPAGEAPDVCEGYDPNDGQMVRLSHFSGGSNPEIKYLPDGSGFWTGINSLQVTDVAERYDELISGLIYGVYIVPGKNYVSGDGSINVNIWSGGEKPGILLSQKSNFFISNRNQKEVLVMFDEPVPVSGPFFVGYEVDYSAPIDSFGVYQAVDANGKNSFYVNEPVNGWEAYNTLSGNVSSAMWMDVLVGKAVFCDTSSVDNPGLFVLAPNPAVYYVDIFSLDAGSGIVTIYDMSGRALIKKRVAFSDNKARIDFNRRLPGGTYLLQIEYDNRKVVYKFIVE